MKRIIVFLSLLVCVVYGEGTALGEGEGDPPLFAMPATEPTSTFTPTGTIVTSPNFVVGEFKPPATTQQCDTNLQCDDGNPCTVDKCSNGSCNHSPISGCPDKDPTPNEDDPAAQPETPEQPQASPEELVATADAPDPVAPEETEPDGKGEEPKPEIKTQTKIRYAICLYGDHEAFWADTGERFLLSDPCEPLPTRAQLVSPEAYKLFQGAAEYERDPQPERLARLRETLANTMVNDTRPLGQEPYTVKSLSVLATTASIDLVRFKEHVAQKRDLVLSSDGTLEPMSQEALTAISPTGGQVESLVIGIDAATATGGGGSCALISPRKTAQSRGLWMGASRRLAECRQEIQEAEQTLSETWRPYEEYYNDHHVAQSMEDCYSRLDELEERLRLCLEKRTTADRSAGESSDGGCRPGDCPPAWLGEGGISTWTLSIPYTDAACSRSWWTGILCLNDCRATVEEIRQDIEWLRRLPPPEEYWHDKIDRCEERVRETGAALATCEGN